MNPGRVPPGVAWVDDDTEVRSDILWTIYQSAPSQHYVLDKHEDLFAIKLLVF